jgi:hypothetical protein
MPTPARIIAIPTSDAAFADEARRIAATVPACVADADAIDWYRLALHRAYPTAVVQAEVPRAGAVGEGPLWYAMRHDHPFWLTTSIWVPVPPDEAWHLYVDRAPEWLATLHPRPRTVAPEVLERDYDLEFAFLGTTYDAILRFLAAEPGWCLTAEIEGSGWSTWWTATFLPERHGSLMLAKGGYEVPHDIIATVANRLWIEAQMTRAIDKANDTFRELCVAAAGAREPVGAVI